MPAVNRHLARVCDDLEGWDVGRRGRLRGREIYKYIYMIHFAALQNQYTVVKQLSSNENRAICLCICNFYHLSISLYHLPIYSSTVYHLSSVCTSSSTHLPTICTVKGKSLSPGRLRDPMNYIYK